MKALTTYPAAVLKNLFPDRQPLTALLLIFFATAFFIPQESLWAMIFYFGVGPCLLYRLARKPGPDIGQPLVILIAVLILWSALTLIWGENPGGHRVQKYAWGAVSTAMFILAIMTTVKDRPNIRHTIGSIFIFCGAVNAALSIVWFATHMPGQWRLGGFAETAHPILGALVIGVCALYALDRMLREQRHNMISGIAVAIMLIFILLTQSKGPILSILAAMAVLSLGISWRKGTALLAILAAIAGSAVGLLYWLDGPLVQEILRRLHERGTSYRLDIWSFTLQRVAERPLTGHGMAAYLGMKDFTFPHSLYLSTLFYSGVIGLSLLIATIAAAIIKLLRQRSHHATPLLLALLVNALCGGLTDLGELTPGPATLWIILWLPLALIAAQPTDKVIKVSTI